ncbi:MAG: hypothetical protein WA790_10485 [Sulfitobacter sp.]
MNRREFTASLAALGFLPALPIAVPAVAATAPNMPAGTYAWAHLIARAQTKCSPAMLARQLHLSPEVAQHLFNTMVSDGVLKAPGIAGVAKAAQPINATGVEHSLAKRMRTRLKDYVDGTQSDDPVQAQRTDAPLAKDAEPCLGCETPQTEDQTDASTDQSVQESPQRG